MHSKSVIYIPFLLFLSISGFTAGLNRSGIWNNPVLRVIKENSYEKNSASLLPYLTNTNALVRREAILALKNIQDTKILKNILPLFSDSDLSVRQAAVQAAGFLAGPETWQTLARAVEKENDLSVKADLYEAIGRSGGTNGLNYLTSQSLFMPDTVLSGIARGIYQSALKGYNSKDGSSREAQFLAPGYFREIRYYAVQYFAAANGIDRKPYVGVLVKFCGRENEPALIVPAEIALGKSADPEALETLKLKYRAAVDPIEKEVLLRAFGNYSGREVRSELLKMACSPDYQTASAAVQSLMQTADYQTAIDSMAKVKSASHWYGRAKLLEIAYRFSPAWSDVKTKAEKQIRLLLKASKNDYERAVLLSVLVRNPAFAVEILDSVQAENGSITSTAVYYTLADVMPQWKDVKLYKLLLPYIAGAFMTGDNALVATLSRLLRSNDIDFRGLYSDFSFLYLTRDILGPGGDYSARKELGMTIAYFENKPVVPSFKPHAVPLDWMVLSDMKTDPEVQVKTTRGVFTVELDPENYPGAVSAFIWLAQKRFYYNNLIYQYQDWMIQGGSVREDGETTGIFEVGSEYGQKELNESGVFGFVNTSEGLEYSRFFISLLPHPDLNGSVSCFGKIISGMEVVRKLEPGDKILDIIQTK